MTRADKTRQLTTEQENAVDLLVTGVTDADVAEQVGVTRQTVCGWRNRDPLFAATLNARRRDLWSGHADRLRALVARALDVLEADLGGDEPRLRQAAAVHILRAVGTYGAQQAPPGPTSPEAVEQAWFEDAVIGR